MLAGGVESMSQAEYYSTKMRWGARMRRGRLQRPPRARRASPPAARNHPVPGGMLETAENLRREYGIPREEQDELALRSHQRAVAAHEDGRFAEEIVAVESAREGWAIWTSIATSTRAPMRSSRRSGSCGR